MALDVYFREDIQHAIEAANLDSGSPPNLVELIRDCENQKHLADMIKAYQHGHSRALQKIGTAFGILVIGK